MTLAQLRDLLAPIVRRRGFEILIHWNTILIRRPIRTPKKPLFEDRSDKWDEWPGHENTIKSGL